MACRAKASNEGLIDWRAGVVSRRGGSGVAGAEGAARAGQPGNARERTGAPARRFRPVGVRVRHGKVCGGVRRPLGVTQRDQARRKAPTLRRTVAGHLNLLAAREISRCLAFRASLGRPAGQNRLSHLSRIVKHIPHAQHAWRLWPSTQERPKAAKVSPCSVRKTQAW
jgi:hypothetical protein